jgi:hypothetical protein
VARRIRSILKSNNLIGNRTRDPPACSIVPQPTTLPRAPTTFKCMVKYVSLKRCYPPTRLNGVKPQMTQSNLQRLDERKSYVLIERFFLLRPGNEIPIYLIIYLEISMLGQNMKFCDWIYTLTCVYWIMTPLNLLSWYKRFEGIYCFHLHGRIFSSGTLVPAYQTALCDECSLQ